MPMSKNWWQKVLTPRPHTVRRNSVPAKPRRLTVEALEDRVTPVRISALRPTDHSALLAPPPANPHLSSSLLSLLPQDAGTSAAATDADTPLRGDLNELMTFDDQGRVGVRVTARDVEQLVPSL